MMSERRTFTVVTEGVGRKDYSIDVKRSVEQLARFHQGRNNWSVNAWTLPSVPWPGGWFAFLSYFEATDPNHIYVPNTPKYVIYYLELTGQENCTTYTALMRWLGGDTANPTYVDTIAEAFGQQRATLNLSKGHVLSPGYNYGVTVTQYPPLNPTFTIDLVIHALTDTVLT